MVRKAERPEANKMEKATIITTLKYIAKDLPQDKYTPDALEILYRAIKEL